MNKHLGSPPCKILGAILKMEKRGTQTNGPKYKKVDNIHKALHPRDNIDRVCVGLEKEKKKHSLALRIK